MQTAQKKNSAVPVKMIWFLICIGVFLSNFLAKLLAFLVFLFRFFVAVCYINRISRVKSLFGCF